MLRSRTSEWILATSKDMVGNLLRGILNQMTWMYLEVDATLPFTWDKLTILWDANGWVSKFTVFVPEKSTLQMHRTNMTEDIWMPTRCPWGKMSSTYPQKKPGNLIAAKELDSEEMRFSLCLVSLGGIGELDQGELWYFWMAFWGWCFTCPSWKGVPQASVFLGSHGMRGQRMAKLWSTGWFFFCVPPYEAIQPCTIIVLGKQPENLSGDFNIKERCFGHRNI